MKKVRMFTVIAVMFACMATLPLAAEATCSNSILSGGYGFTLSGFLQVHTGQPVAGSLAFAESGLRTFDGNGGFTDSHDALSVAGTVLSPEASGTYVFDSDTCTTGTMTLTDGLTERFTLVNAAQELEVIVTTPGRVIFGSMKKQ